MERKNWSKKAINQGIGLPLFLFDNGTDELYGAITLDNIRRGPTQSGTLGYWIGEEYARRGYMTEAINAIVQYAFMDLDLSRIESACLADNKPSRGVLEKCGFKYEGDIRASLGLGFYWTTAIGPLSFSWANPIRKMDHDKTRTFQFNIGTRL